MSSNYVIAIDGPTASGKGTVARLLAKKLGVSCLDTGSIYRGITVFMLDNGIDIKNAAAVTAAVGKLDLNIECNEGRTLVFVNGENITDKLYSMRINQAVFHVAHIAEVRVKVREIQQSIANRETFVCEGRDTTSVVFPNARFKFFLTAKLKVRTKRRYNELMAKGEKVKFETVLDNIQSRDRADKTRKNSPLVRVKDSVLIDTTKLDAVSAAEKMEKFISDSAKNDFKAPRGATAFRRFLKFLVFIPYRLLFWIRVINKKEIKPYRKKPVIFCINHRSFSDIPTVFIAFPEVNLHFIARESLLKRGHFMNRFLRSLNAVPVRYGYNELALIRNSIAKLNNNNTLVIYPEGRRNFNSDGALVVKNGVSMIALKSGAPVIPIVTNRAPRPFVWNKFKIGKAIQTTEYENAQSLSDAIVKSMTDMLKDFEYKPRPKKWEKEPVVNAKAILFRNGKIALIKRTKDGQNFYYVIPGGHLEKGETPRDAAIREMKEETDLTVDAVRLVYKHRYRDQMQAFYSCEYQGGELSETNAEEYTTDFQETSNEYGEIRGSFEPVWVDLSDLRTLDVRPNCVKKQIIKDIKKYGMNFARPTKYLR